MGAKITLVGTMDSTLRKTDKYFAFEMDLGGSPTAPKGLPLPSRSVQYTAFVSHKAGRKINLESLSKTEKIVIQGEIALDIPIEQCPGEIGVIAFQVSIVPSMDETKDTKNDEAAALEETKKAMYETAASVETIAPVEVAPETENKNVIVPISDIHVPEEYLQTTLHPLKTEALRQLVREHGELDKPIAVKIQDNQYWLTDGYRRYVIASEEGFKEVPIQIQTP